MLHYYCKRESSEVNSNAQNWTQPQRRNDLSWPQTCEAPPASVSGWYQKLLQVLDDFRPAGHPVEPFLNPSVANVLHLCLVGKSTLWMFCLTPHRSFLCASLTFLSDHHLQVMSLPVWRKTCLVPVWLQMLDVELFSLSLWQQTTRFNVSWRIRQHRNTLETETTVGGRQSAEAGNNKHGCFHEPSSEQLLETFSKNQSSNIRWTRMTLLQTQGWCSGLQIQDFKTSTSF